MDALRASTCPSVSRPRESFGAAFWLLPGRQHSDCITALQQRGDQVLELAREALVHHQYLHRSSLLLTIYSAMSHTAPLTTNPQPLVPIPSAWFGRQRLALLKQELLVAVPTLTVSGLLRQAVEGWIRQQLAADAPWTKDERDLFAEAQVQHYTSKRSPAKFGHTPDSLLLHLSTGEGCRLWSRAQWGDQLHSLYLERKNELDMARCSLLRVSSQALARELFFRIRAGEASFDEIASRFSEGPERQTGGRLPMQPMSAMPYGLSAVLGTLKPGDLTLPCQLGSHWALVQLHELVCARFDDDAVQAQLLADQLSSWLSGAVSFAIGLLVSENAVAADTFADPDA